MIILPTRDDGVGTDASLVSLVHITNLHTIA
jgi:hypothetical protein